MVEARASQVATPDRVLFSKGHLHEPAQLVKPVCDTRGNDPATWLLVRKPGKNCVLAVSAGLFLRKCSGTPSNGVRLLGNRAKAHTVAS
jgi:hypothetical protein